MSTTGGVPGVRDRLSDLREKERRANDLARVERDVTSRRVVALDEPAPPVIVAEPASATETRTRVLARLGQQGYRVLTAGQNGRPYLAIKPSGVVLSLEARRLMGTPSRVMILVGPSGLALVPAADRIKEAHRLTKYGQLAGKNVAAKLLQRLSWEPGRFTARWENDVLLIDGHREVQQTGPTTRTR